MKKNYLLMRAILEKKYPDFTIEITVSDEHYVDGIELDDAIDFDPRITKIDRFIRRTGKKVWRQARPSIIRRLGLERLESQGMSVALNY